MRVAARWLGPRLAPRLAGQKRCLSTSTIPPEQVRTIAAALIEARRQGARVVAPADSDEIASLTLEDGYAIQRAMTAWNMLEKGGNQIGWKIAATNEAAQARLKIVEPMRGPLYAMDIKHYFDGDEMDALSDSRFSHDHVGVRGVEAEICIQLDAELPARDEPYSMDEVAAAIGDVMPALEVCAGRWASDSPVPTPLFLADACGNGAVVCGAPLNLTGADLRACVDSLSEVRVSLAVNGEQKAAGTGALAAGHPVKALTWLANSLSETQRGLRKHDLVMTGTCLLPNLVAVEPNDIVYATFEFEGGHTEKVSCCFSS